MSAAARLLVPFAMVVVAWSARGTVDAASRHDVATTSDAAPSPVTDSLLVDARRSVLRWTGTKFRGRGRHEGTVQVSSGALHLCGERPCGGRFVVDMRTIAVTDIPAHEPVPRERLTRHLLSRDFFWVERFPTATFHLRAVRPTGGARHEVTGALTLRGATRDLVFPATVATRTDSARHVAARFTIDRQRWGIEYRFDPLRNELVDDEIQLELSIVLVEPRGRVRSVSR